MVLKTAPGTGVIDFKSNPVGATVFIDDMEYNKTPVTINNIPTGKHDFKLVLDGYTDFVDSAEVIEQKICCQTIDLAQKASAIVCNPATIQIEEPTLPTTTPKVTAPAEISNGEYVIIGIIIGVTIVLAYQYIQKDSHKEK